MQKETLITLALTGVMGLGVLFYVLSIDNKYEAKKQLELSKENYVSSEKQCIKSKSSTAERASILKSCIITIQELDEIKEKDETLSRRKMNVYEKGCLLSAKNWEAEKMCRPLLSFDKFNKPKNQQTRDTAIEASRKLCKSTSSKLDCDIYVSLGGNMHNLNYGDTHAK